MGLFRGRTVTTRANKISDFTVATASYGGAVPVIYGTSRLAGNVIYYDDFTAHEHRETQRTGKGGKSKSVSITYTYTVAVILGLCEGPIHSVGKVWLGKDVYQYPSDQIGMTLYDGSQKAPWPYVKGKHPDKALTYENLAYMAGVIDLGDSGSMPDYNFEVRGMLTATGDGTDANPADVIRDILDKVGLSGVEIIGLDNYRKYCREADLLISSPTDTTEAKAAHDIINELMTLTNAYMFWSNNKFKIVCKADRPVGSWAPDTTIQYDLTADDFLESNGALVTCQRKDSSEIYNRFPVEFISRKNSYETETVAYELKDDIAEYGLRQASSTTAHWFYTKERAVKVAEQLARDALYGRNKFTFKLDWAFCRLEVGDLVTLTDSALGLDKTPVMIDSVTENTDGTLTFTAISRPPMKASKPAYDVHEGDRPYIDYNADAPDTDTPLIMQPPAELTTSGLEVWIGAKGKGDLWGGCEVYVADDGTNYRAAGTIASSARVGTLAKSIKATDTSLEVACNGTFLSGSQQDAERGNTLCWIDGECLSYQGATLLDNGHWKLDGCIRGQHTTTAAAHDAGAQFARLDASLLRIPFLSEDVGKKVYLKFVSFNIFGAGVQDLASVKAYEYTIKKYYIPAVKNVRAHNRYRHLADGVSRYDVVVHWDPPDMDSYAAGQVWYRTNAGQVQDLTAINGVPASELGYYGKWIFGGQGKNEVVIPQAVVGDTYEIAVTTVDKWAASTDLDLAPKVRITVAMKTMVPNTPDGLGIAFGESAVASWNEVTNTDIAFYELRLDQQAGVESANLLARVTGLTATLPLTNRTGTIYLFAYSASGHYSYPAVLAYSKATPPTPTAPTLTAKLGGFSLVAGTIPSGCNGMNIYIDGVTLVSVHTVNNVYTYTCDAGIYDVQVAYTDIFGEGAKSAVSRVTVKATVDSSLLESQAVTKAKLETALQDAVDDAVNSVTEIARLDTAIDDLDTDISSVESKADGIITELGKAPAQSGYRSISDLKTDVDNVSITVASNKTTQDGINSTVGSRLTVAEGGISAITTNLNKAAGSTGYAAITQLNTSVSGLQSQVEEIYKMTDEGIAPDITVMKSQITQNSNAINTMVTNLNSSASGNAYSSISSLSQTADSISSRVTTTENQLAGTASSALNTAITQNTNGITSVASRVTTTESQLDGTATSTLLTRINQNASGISAVVADVSDVADDVADIEDNLNDSTKARSYTALQVMQDDIALRVKSGEVVSQINLSKEGVQIDGKLLHVTGETVFDNNIVTSKMLQAANISLEGALAITGGNVYLNEDGMQVTQSNGESIMFDGKGMTFFDASGNAYNSVRRMIIGTAKHNQYVKFPVAWPTAPKVLVTPLSVTTADNNKSGAIIRIHCRATDVSPSGFRVMCYSGIDNTSYWQSVNTDLGSFSGARGYTDGSIRQTFSWTKDISVDSRARLIRLNLYFSGDWHAKGAGIGIGESSTNDAPFTRVTVTAAGKTVLSEDVGGTDGGYFDNWSGQSVQTSQFQIPSVSTIAVNIQWRPRVHHPGKSNDAGDVGDGKCTLQSIEGTMQGDDSTQVIDSDGTALFLAVDQSTQNYSVE